MKYLVLALAFSLLPVSAHAASVSEESLSHTHVIETPRIDSRLQAPIPFCRTTRGSGATGAVLMCLGEKKTVPLLDKVFLV